MRRLATIYGWEFLQNVAVIFGLMWGLSLWKQATALACGLLVLGGVLSALLIRWTERYIDKSFDEQWRTTVINAICLSMGCLLLAFYLQTFSSGWMTDVLVGVGLGGIFGLLQKWTHPETPVFHIAALIVSALVALLLIRLLMPLPVGVSGLLLTAIFSLGMVLVDYVPRLDTLVGDSE